MPVIKETQLRYLEYIHREDSFRHHRYDEEMEQYYLLRAGDLRAIEESKRMWSSGLTGHVNDDELKNRKYLFVASITLACRFAILGGLDEERSYDISDLYIHRVDRCKSVDEITILHTDMFTFYTKEVANAKRKKVISRPVAVGMDFIHYHLHEKLTTQRVANAAGLSPNYLSVLFKKELGMSVTDYITDKRMEAAKNMLRFSSFPYDEIAAILAFSSQSHFTKVFKQASGMTPKEYRTLAYREEARAETDA